MATVTTTGAATHYGRIGTLMADIRPSPTPLQRLIRRLIGRLAMGAGLFSVAVIGVELLRGTGWGAAVIAGVSLAIAAVPEEFPMVFTLYLTLGAWRLTRQRALIRRLAGVETLGSTTVICTDKTGTLTFGHLEVAAIVSADSTGPLTADAPLNEPARNVLEAALLASEPHPFDPLEQALMRYAATHGIDATGLYQGELLADYPFDPVGKYVTHVWRRNGRSAVYAKGGIEGVLSRCQHGPEVERVRAAHDAWAGQGMRVIAVAAGDLGTVSGWRETDERALRLVGLVAFSDPIRPGVREALDDCRAAGIRVIMITGDHPATARAVATELGLTLPADHPVVTGNEVDASDDARLGEMVRTASVFARARPEHKHRLVRALRAQGEVTAMTGDGVNDAPALRRADIGVAMGKMGTDVAKEAADTVLLDDNFATIVAAVEEGRVIYDNVRKFVRYTLTGNSGEIWVMLVASLLAMPLPLLPLQILWVNLVTDGLPSLALAVEPREEDVMRRPPRPPTESIMARGLGHHVLWVGVLIALISLAPGYVLWQQGSESWRTLIFSTLALAQMGHVLAIRSERRSLFRLGLGSNRALLGAVLMTVGLQVAVVYQPFLQRVFGTTALSPLELALCLVAGGVTFGAVELEKRLRRDRFTP